MKTGFTSRQKKTLATGVLMMFSFAGIVANGFSVFQPFLVSLNGFSNAEVSLVMTMRIFSAFAAMLLYNIV